MVSQHQDSHARLRMHPGPLIIELGLRPALKPTGFTALSRTLVYFVTHKLGRYCTARLEPHHALFKVFHGVWPARKLNLPARYIGYSFIENYS